MEAGLTSPNLLRDSLSFFVIKSVNFQRMKISYYPDTDSLYIDLSEQQSTESREVSEGVVLDYDAQGRLVGIDIDNASRSLKS